MNNTAPPNDDTYRKKCLKKILSTPIEKCVCQLKKCL